MLQNGNKRPQFIWLHLYEYLEQTLLIQSIGGCGENVQNWNVWDFFLGLWNILELYDGES